MENENEHYSVFCQFRASFDDLQKNQKALLNEKTVHEFVTDFYKHLYYSIHCILDPKKEYGDNEKYIRYYVKYIVKVLLPFAKNKIKSYGMPKDNVGNKLVMLNKWIDLEDDLYALAACRNLKMFVLYYERGMPLENKHWAKTMPIFESFFYYANKMILNNDMSLIRASYFPGAGKTYAGNLMCAFWFGIREIGILRITYSDDLAKTFTQQICNIVESERYKKVFPKFNLDEKDLYKTKNSGEIWFSFYKKASFYATTRNGQTTGKRAPVLMLDDLTKGADEAANFETHLKNTKKYDSDWGSRSDSGESYKVLLGTMWASYDLLNEVQKRAEKKGHLEESDKFKYTRLSKDKREVFISVPVLDYDTDESTCPLRYDTEYLRELRDNFSDKALFNAVYQQTPDEPEELVLNHRQLQHYDDKTIPKEILENNCECRAMIDPNRKGFDYFACGFFKRYLIKEGQNEEWSKWYLVDCIYRKEILKVIMPLLIQKCISNKVDKLTVEINTSNELVMLLEDKFEEKGYNDVEINGIFSSEKKEEKIANSLYGMKEEIIYPAKSLYKETSEMGKAMLDFTTYDINGKNKHDDFPDMVSMFVKYNCEEETKNVFQVLDSCFRL